MFKAIINNTPLVNDAANAFFQHIYGDSFNGDISFISTLRALVAPRIKDGERIQVRFYGTSYSAESIGNVSTTSAVRSVCDYIQGGYSGDIYIHSFNASDQADNYANLELINTTFLKVYKDWGRLEKVTDFFRKQFRVLCFINPELKSVALFTDTLDMRRMHYLQCAIFAFLPWYFNPEEGVNELEMALIESLREKTSAKYEEIIAKIAEQYDFRTERIKQMLSGFETKFERMECNNVRNQIQRTLNNIESLNNRIGDELRQKNSLEIKLLGLETKIAQGCEESEIMEYFLCNNKLVLYNVNDSRMTFIVKDYLTYFDEDMAKTVINNDSSYVYQPNGRSCNNYIPASDVKMLMNALFIDQILKIKLCAAYTFDLNGSVIARHGFEFGSDGMGCMPNPHINNYSCLGSYQTTINNLLKNRNYIAAIEQCAASCKSLNFSDSAVMQCFMEDIYGLSRRSRNGKYIETPNGLVLSPKEAIQWLKDNAGGIENE